MTPEKIDYPPLLEGGLHPLDLSALAELTVTSFPNSTRRKPLFESLEVYLTLLSDTGLRANIWVDGSFMCSKLEPDDIDIVVVFDPESLRPMAAETQKVLEVLLDKNFAMARFKLHVFNIRQDLQADADFWLTLFGHQRDEITPKGIAELRINHD